MGGGCVIFPELDFHSRVHTTPRKTCVLFQKYVEIHGGCPTLPGVREQCTCRLVPGQLMAKEGTEPAIFVNKVAKQHDVFIGAIAFRVLVSARASF